MKEAAGEANLTVIAIILIGVIAAVLTPMINSYMTTSAKKGCCTNAGGFWNNNSCQSRDAAGNLSTISDTTYWNSGDRTCK
jgi:putative effector of murein hydrolase